MSELDPSTSSAKLGSHLGRLTPWLVTVLTLAALAAHTFKVKGIEIDAISLGLLGVLLVASRWDLIRRLKFGEFEAEIDPAEVRQVQASVATEIGAAQPDDLDHRDRDILDLVRHDPTLGMAKLRIELERVLRALHRSDGRVHPSRSVPLGHLARELAQRGDLPGELVGPILKVTALANRAIHGEAVRREDVETIALLGVQLLDDLRDQLQDRVLQPIRSEVISPGEVERLRDAHYRVTTVIPLVHEPTRNIRVLDQEGLDRLLEGYAEYAEFVVAVQLIEDGEEGNAAR